MPRYIGYLSLHNRLLHGLAASNNNGLTYSQLCGEAIWSQLGGFSSGFARIYSNGCGHLATWLGLDGPRWPHSRVGGRFGPPAGLAGLAPISKHGDWIPKAERLYAPCKSVCLLSACISHANAPLPKQIIGPSREPIRAGPVTQGGDTRRRASLALTVFLSLLRVS